MLSRFRHICSWWYNAITTILIRQGLELADALSAYEAALRALPEGEADPEAAERRVLALLAARDQVGHALAHTGAVEPAQFHRLIALDKELRECSDQVAWTDLATWRQSVQPLADRWWWRLDEARARAEEKRDFPWVLLGGALMIITLIPTVDIISRMWGGDFDPLFVISTSITMVLTSSPLTQAGREVAGWLMDKVHLPTRYRGETMLGTAVLSLMVVLLLRSALPAVAITYNNRGYTLLQAGDLTGAQQAFTRAIHINPDYAVGYHNLAEAYVEISDYEQAHSLYTQALATDPNLDVAYNGLGHVLLLQEKPDQTILILYTGLRVAQDDVVRAALWTNLGRAYFAAMRYREAETALQQALALNREEAAAHCTLALTAETLSRPENEIILHWENCLRHVPDTPRGQELRAMAQAHLQQLREGR